MTKREQVLEVMKKAVGPMTGGEICRPLGFTNWGGVFTQLAGEGLIEHIQYEIDGVRKTGYRMLVKKEEVKPAKAPKVKAAPKPAPAPVVVEVKAEPKKAPAPKPAPKQVLSPKEIQKLKVIKVISKTHTNKPANSAQAGA